MKKIYLIGNSHIDPVWLWQWQEGFAEIKATFRSALDRMNEYEDFVFTSACGCYYMWIEKSDPKMFSEIQERVKEGRWCLVGGWFLQPDCNIPSGESFARHALITQRYFQEKFGIMAETGYNVDSFGHNGNLPMILKNSRMKNYVFMRPQPHEKDLPQSLFVWESRDGSQVTTYRVPFFYNIDERRFQIFEKVRDIKEDTDQMAFYGVGNHGGGVTVALLDQMHRELPSIQYLYSDPNCFFADQKSNVLPVVHGDLQYHAKGCYSAMSEIKSANRHAENALITAEKMMILSENLVQTSYPHAELERAWYNVLFNQFHDIMGGCCIREAYEDAKLFHGESMAIASRNINFATQQISWNIDTIGTHEVESFISEEKAEEIGTPVVIFNPHAHEVRGTVHIRNAYGFQTYESVRDNEGNQIPIQTVRDSKTDGNKKYARLFQARIPALGYAVYRLYKKIDENTDYHLFQITDTSISNQKIKISFDKNSGELVSLFDLIHKKELLSASTQIQLFNDEKHDTWAHDVESFQEEIPVSIFAKVSVIEVGPVRATIRVVQTFENSTLTRDFSLLSDSDVVTVNVKLDFHERFRILKFAVPVNCSNPKAICKIPFGSIDRANDGTEQVCGDWIALTGDETGICVASDSKHSFDANKNVLSLTVLRSALYADHFGQNERDEFCDWMDQGIHRFTYSLFAFQSIGDAEKRSAELQIPLIHVQETFHRGTLPTVYQGIRVNKPNISVTCIKKQVNDEGIVLRCYETDGLDTDVHISLFDLDFDFRISHYAVKTFLLKEGKIQEIDFVEKKEEQL